MKIFISHIHEETSLAKVLKEWISSTFLGMIEIFVSSDPDDIPAGSQWLEKIENSISNADILIILCSPESINRPWINFETGCCWIKKRSIIPICHSGLSLSQLPVPLSMFQALDILDENFPNLLLKGLSKKLNINQIPKIDTVSMMSEILKSIPNFPHPENDKQDISIHQINKELRLTPEDIISIIESWMGSRPAELNKKIIYFQEVDNELNLPNGSAQQYLETASQRWDYTVIRKSENTILLKEKEINFSRNRRSFLDTDF